MKIVLVTNVFMSGVFFGGVPERILVAWQAGDFDLAVSLDIFTEYERVGHELSDKYPEVNPAPFLELVALQAEMWECEPLQEQVCADPDDDKFLACALAAGANHVITGDKLLLQVSGFQGIEVLRPREFVDRYLDPAQNDDS